MLFITFNNDQNLAVCSPSLNAIFYQTPSQRIFILWKFIVLNVYFKGILTESLVLFLILAFPTFLPFLKLLETFHYFLLTLQGTKVPLLLNFFSSFALP